MSVHAIAVKVEAKWSYRPTDDEAACALTVAQRRNTMNGGRSNLPVETMSIEERLRQHYTATLSEIAGSRLLNLSWSGCGKGGGGDLCDIGDLIDARSITKLGRGLTARPRDRDDRPCILVYVEESRWCRAIGWEYFGIVKQSGNPFDAHTSRPAWWLPQSKLQPMDALEQLVWGVKNA